MNTTKVRQERSIHRISNSIFIFLSPFLSPINVGISAIAVLYTSFSLFGLRHNVLLLLAAFLLTFAVYLLNVVTDFEEDSINQPIRMKAYEMKNAFLFISFFSCIIAISIGFYLNIESIFVMLIPFIIGFLYSVRIANFRIKNLFLAKNISISLSWAMEASLMPYVFKPFYSFFLAVFLLIFIKGMINTILFDLRDVEGDRMSKIITIPVKMGKKKTFFLLLLLNSSLFLWLFLFMDVLIRHILFVLICIFYGYAYIIYFYISKKRHNLLYSILVDDEWLLWMFLINFL